MMKPDKSTKPESNLQNAALQANQPYTIEVGRLGRVVGLHGAMAFYMTSDFVEFMQVGLVLFEERFHQTLTIQSIEKKQRYFLLSFVEIDSRERAQEFVNARLFTTEAQTREYCVLKQGEFFYFDVVGLEVIEEGVVLGRVEDIERIGLTDYFVVALDSTPIVENLADTKSPTDTKNLKSSKRSQKRQKTKRCLLPYIDEYVLHIELAESGKRGGVFTQNAKLLFE